MLGEAEHGDYAAIDKAVELWGNMSQADQNAIAASRSTVEDLYSLSKDGINAESFYKAYDAVHAIEKEPGEESVPTWKKYEAVLNNTGLTDRDNMFRAFMSEEAYERYTDARSYGVSAADYVNAEKAIGILEKLPGEDSITTWQKYEAIAGSASGKTVDDLFKAWMSADAFKTYSTARSSGASAQTFADCYKAIATTMKLPGRESLANWQKFAAILDTAPARERDAMFRAYMADGTYQRYEAAMADGLSPTQFVDAYTTYQMLGDNPKKADIISNYMALGYSKNMATYLYYLFKGQLKQLDGYSDKYLR